MSDAQNVSSKPHFRNLRVEPFRPQPFIAGFGGDSDRVDVASFVSERYKVTFEYRTGWRRKWRKVIAYT